MKLWFRSCCTAHVWVALACAAPIANTRAACLTPPAGAQEISEGPLRVAWLAQPKPVVGRPFLLKIFVCPADLELVRVDAQMPEHRHGMNYRTSLKHLGQGHWQAQGLLWHMSGRWELSLDVQHPGGQQRFLQSVQLP